MGQDDDWGKLTNPTWCLNWEHTVNTGHFPITYSCKRTRAVEYTWNFVKTRISKNISCFCLKTAVILSLQQIRPGGSILSSKCLSH